MTNYKTKCRVLKISLPKFTDQSINELMMHVGGGEEDCLIINFTRCCYSVPATHYNNVYVNTSFIRYHDRTHRASTVSTAKEC